jgi:hypothetical protein
MTYSRRQARMGLTTIIKTRAKALDYNNIRSLPYRVTPA